MTRPALAALYLLIGLGLCAASGLASELTFGSVHDAASAVGIRWEGSQQVELSSERLRLAGPGAAIRSAALPLQPLRYYRVHATMERGPGSKPRITISYLTSEGKTIEWQPAWQHQHRPHADWLPLSVHVQRYVQGFVLPRGASEPRLNLRLEPTDPNLARYNHWTLHALRIEARHEVACCEHVGANLLWNGDFQPSSDGLPNEWTLWGATAGNSVQLIESSPRALQIKAGSTVHLFSRYFAEVTPGRAYRISVRARGHGRVGLNAHSHTQRKPIPLRVGNHDHGRDPIDVRSDTWQEVSSVWFAEAPHTALADVVVSIAAHSTLEIASVELRPFE